MTISEANNKLDSIPIWIEESRERKENGFAFTLPFEAWYMCRLFSEGLQKGIASFDKLTDATNEATAKMNPFVRGAIRLRNLLGKDPQIEERKAFLEFIGDPNNCKWPKELT